MLTGRYHNIRTMETFIILLRGSDNCLFCRFDVCRFECFYHGQWSAGKKHGLGIQQWRRGVYYEGLFENGYICGFGRMVWQEVMGLV